MASTLVAESLRWLLAVCLDQARFMRELHFGVLSAQSTRAPVTFAVPLACLRFLFPRLWPEAEADTLTR